MEALAGLLTSKEFLTGAVAGLVGVGLAFVLRKWPADWGLLWAAGVIGVMLSLGLVRFAGGGSLSRGPATSAVAILAGLVVAAVAAYGIWRLSEFETGGPAFAISIAGIWATVPDTERAAVLIGVTAIFVLAWWPAMWSVPGGLGAIAVALLAVWVVTIGGAARDTGLIGGLGSLAALAWSVVAMPSFRPWIWLAGHGITVAVWSRWAGLLESSVAAVAVGVIASVVVAAVFRLLPPGQVRQREIG